MPYLETTATKKIKSLDKRIRVIAGGTSASKTISVLLYLIAKAQYDKQPTLTSIVSESFPHLRRGAMRDFLNILGDHGYIDAYGPDAWSKSEYTFTFPNKSKIEFFSADMPSKVRGPRRDRLFVNEANNIEKESWDQLLLRTREFAIADWNPVNDFFMYEDYGLQDEGIPSSTDKDCQFIILTYKDNEALEPAIVNEIEKRKEHKQWFRVYGQGLRGEVEGKIFTGWRIVDDIPHEARLERRGLDFGFSNDPTALVDIYYYNGGYILDEQLYRKGMHNKDIADKINSLEQSHVLVVADSAEPKSIDEISNYGVNITGADKGPGSVKRMIDYVQSQRVSVTKRSTNLIKSYRNFMWKTDKEGKILNEYDHYWSDGMMATCYGMNSLVGGKKLHVYKPPEIVRLKQQAHVTNNSYRRPSGMVQ
jgi:phage terminase large subunit